MKAKELQIGDWIIADGKPNKVSTLRKHPENRTIGCFGKYGEIFDNTDKIIPIPLTEEVLEANGFRNAKRETDGVICAAVYKHNGIFVWHHYDKNYVRISNYGDNSQWYTQVSCHYVHELQHALRLCGLHELADKFKVE